MLEQFNYDILVVGSGAAGLRAAIAAKSMGQPSRWHEMRSD